MKSNFTPILTDAREIFTPYEIQEFRLMPQLNTDMFNWGEDRIIDLSKNDTSIKSQFNGTCTTFATIAAMENKLKGAVDLSERSLWHYYRKTFTAAAIEASATNWILDEKFWPSNTPSTDPTVLQKGRYQLSKFINLHSNYLDVLSALDNGNACIVALSTPKDLRRQLPQVEASSKIYGNSGHAMCVSGYKVENGEAYFKVKNSWGPECGSNGYQYVSFALFDRRKAYAKFWEVREVSDRGEQAGLDKNGFDYLLEEIEVEAAAILRSE